MEHYLAPTTPKKVAQRRAVSSAGLVRSAVTPLVDHDLRRSQAARSLLSSELAPSRSTGALPVAALPDTTSPFGNRRLRSLASTQPAPHNPRGRQAPHASQRVLGRLVSSARPQAFEASIDQFADASGSDSAEDSSSRPHTTGRGASHQSEGKARSKHARFRPPSDLSKLQLPADMPGMHVTMESLAANSRSRAEAISAELGGILRNVAKATEKFAQPPVIEMHDADEWADAVSRMDDSARRQVAGMNAGVLLPKTPTRASTREAASAEEEITGVKTSLDSQGVAWKRSFQGQHVLDGAGEEVSLQGAAVVSGRRKAAVTPALLATQLSQVDEALNESHERHIEQRKGLRDVARRVATMQRRQRRDAKQRRRQAKAAQKLAAAVQNRGLRDVVMAESSSLPVSPQHLATGALRLGSQSRSERTVSFRPFSPGEPGNAFEAPDVFHTGGLSPSLSPVHRKASFAAGDIESPLLQGLSSPSLGGSPLRDQPNTATVESDAQQRLSHRLRSFEALLGMQARRQRKLREQVQQERNLAAQGGTRLRVWHRRHLQREARRQKRLLKANGGTLAAESILTAASDDENGRVAHNWFGKMRAKQARNLTVSPWGGDGQGAAAIWVEESVGRGYQEGMDEPSSSDTGHSSDGSGTSASGDSELETEIRLQAVAAEVQASQSAVQATAAAAGSSSAQARQLFSQLHDAIDKRLGKQHAETLQAALHKTKVSLSEERSAHRATAVRLAALQKEREAMRDAQAAATVAREHADRDIFTTKRSNEELQERLDAALKELVELRTALGAARATETVFKHRHAKADRTKAELLQELQAVTVRAATAEATLADAKKVAADSSAAGKLAAEQAAAAKHEAHLTTTEMNIHKLTLDLRTDEMRRRIKSLSRVLRQRYAGLKQLLHSTVQRVLARTPLAARGPAVVERMFTLQDAEAALQGLQSIKDGASELGTSAWEDSSDEEGGEGGARSRRRGGAAHSRARKSTFAIASVSEVTGDLSFAQARVQRDKWVLGLLEAYRDKTKELTRLIHDEQRATLDMASERDAAKAQVSLLNERVQQLSASAMASLSKAERVQALKSDPDEIRARVAAQRSVATIREQLAEAQSALTRARQDRLWADAQAQGDYLRAMTQAEEAQTSAAEATEALQLLSTEAAETRTMLEGLQEQNADLNKRHTVAESRLVSLARRCASVGIDIGLLAEQYGIAQQSLQSAADMRHSLKQKKHLNPIAAIAFSLGGGEADGAAQSMESAAPATPGAIERARQMLLPGARPSPAGASKRRKGKKSKKRAASAPKAAAGGKAPQDKRHPPHAEVLPLATPADTQPSAAEHGGVPGAPPAPVPRAPSRGSSPVSARRDSSSELGVLAFLPVAGSVGQQLPSPQNVSVNASHAAAIASSQAEAGGGTPPSSNAQETQMGAAGGDTDHTESPNKASKARKRRARGAGSPGVPPTHAPSPSQEAATEQSQRADGAAPSGDDTPQQAETQTPVTADTMPPPPVAVMELSTTAESMAAKRSVRNPPSSPKRVARKGKPGRKSLAPKVAKQVTAGTQTDTDVPLVQGGSKTDSSAPQRPASAVASDHGASASARSQSPGPQQHAVRAVSPPHPERRRSRPPAGPVHSPRPASPVPAAFAAGDSPPAQSRARKASELAELAVRRTHSESAAVGVDCRWRAAELAATLASSAATDTAGQQQLLDAQECDSETELSHSLRETLADCRLENARLRSAVWELEEHMEQAEEMLAACGVAPGPTGHSGAVARRWRLPAAHAPPGASSTLRSQSTGHTPALGGQRTRTVSHGRRGLAQPSADDSASRATRRSRVRSVGTSTDEAGGPSAPDDAQHGEQAQPPDLMNDVRDASWGEAFEQDESTHVDALLDTTETPAPVLGWTDSEESSELGWGDQGAHGGAGGGFATPTGSTGKHVWFAAAGGQARLGPVPEGASAEEQQLHLLAQVAQDGAPRGGQGADTAAQEAPSRPSSTPVPRDLLAQRRALAIRVKQLEGRLQHMARRMQSEHQGKVAALDALKPLQRRLHAYERALEGGSVSDGLALHVAMSEDTGGMADSPLAGSASSPTATEDRPQSFQTPVFRAPSRRGGGESAPPSTGHPGQASFLSPDATSMYQDVGSVRSNLRSPPTMQSSLQTVSGPSRSGQCGKLPPLGRAGTAEGADPSAAMASGRDTEHLRRVAAQLFRGHSAGYTSSSRSHASEIRDGTLNLQADRTFGSGREESAVDVPRPTSSSSTPQLASVRLRRAILVNPASAAHTAVRSVVHDVAFRAFARTAAAVASARTNRALAALHAAWLPAIDACMDDLHAAQSDHRYLGSMLLSADIAQQLPVHSTSVLPLPAEAQERLLYQFRSGNLLLPRSDRRPSSSEGGRPSTAEGALLHMQCVYLSPMLRLQTLAQLMHAAITQLSRVTAASVQDLTLDLSTGERPAGILRAFHGDSGSPSHASSPSEQRHFAQARQRRPSGNGLGRAGIISPGRLRPFQGSKAAESAAQRAMAEQLAPGTHATPGALRSAPLRQLQQGLTQSPLHHSSSHLSRLPDGAAMLSPVVSSTMRPIAAGATPPPATGAVHGQGQRMTPSTSLVQAVTTMPSPLLSLSVGGDRAGTNAPSVRQHKGVGGKPLQQSPQPGSHTASDLSEVPLPRVDGRGLGGGFSSPPARANVPANGAESEPADETAASGADGPSDGESMQDASADTVQSAAIPGADGSSTAVSSSRRAMQSLLAIGNSRGQDEAEGFLPDEFASFAGFG